MVKYLILLIYLFSNFVISFAQNDICETCVEYTLEVFPNKLKGSSLQFPGYDISMILPSNFLKEKISINNLDEQL